MFSFRAFATEPGWILAKVCEGCYRVSDLNFAWRRLQVVYFESSVCLGWLLKAS